VVVTASVATTNWSVSWPDPHAQSVVNAWGMNCKVAVGVIRCDGAEWAAQIPVGGSVTVGLQVAGDGNAPAAPTVTVG
jgi:endoglucanase